MALLKKFRLFVDQNLAYIKLLPKVINTIRFESRSPSFIVFIAVRVATAPPMEYPVYVTVYLS